MPSEDTSGEGASDKDNNANVSSTVDTSAKDTSAVDTSAVCARGSVGERPIAMGRTSGKNFRVYQEQDPDTRDTVYTLFVLKAGAQHEQQLSIRPHSQVLGGDACKKAMEALSLQDKDTLDFSDEVPLTQPVALNNESQAVYASLKMYFILEERGQLLAEVRNGCTQMGRMYPSFLSPFGEQPVEVNRIPGFTGVTAPPPRPTNRGREVADVGRKTTRRVHRHKHSEEAASEDDGMEISVGGSGGVGGGRVGSRSGGRGGRPNATLQMLREAFAKVESSTNIAGVKSVSTDLFPSLGDKPPMGELLRRFFPDRHHIMRHQNQQTLPAFVSNRVAMLEKINEFYKTNKKPGAKEFSAPKAPNPSVLFQSEVDVFKLPMRDVRERERELEKFLEEVKNTNYECRICKPENATQPRCMKEDKRDKLRASFIEDYSKLIAPVEFGSGEKIRCLRDGWPTDADGNADKTGRRYLLDPYPLCAEIEGVRVILPIYVTPLRSVLNERFSGDNGGKAMLRAAQGTGKRGKRTSGKGRYIRVRRQRNVAGQHAASAK